MLGFDLVSALPRVINLPMIEQAPSEGLFSTRSIDDSELIDSLAALGALANPSCFPALDFVMPVEPPSNLDNWWCSATKEYAFLGFSYEVTACTSTVIPTT